MLKHLFFPIFLGVLAALSTLSTPNGPRTLPAVAASGPYGPEALTIHNFNYDLSLNVLSFKSIPRRVVTTNGSATELLLALGLSEHMVGTCYLDNPIMPELREAYDKIPVISEKYPGKERILAAEPDLIVGWHSVFAPQNLGDTSYWNNLGVATIILRDSTSLPKKISNTYEDIMDIGRIFKVEDKSKEIISKMVSQLDDLKRRVAQRKTKLRVLLLEYYVGGHLMIWGDDTTPGSLLETIGAVNVFSTTGERNKESIVAANPDVIVIIYMDNVLKESVELMDSFYTDPILKHIEASKRKQIGLIPLSETYCPEVRLVNGLKHMEDILFPADI
jgi:iron complex transport system substrate-binding protein